MSRSGLLLVQHAGFLSLDTLADALAAWFGNDECRKSSAMPGLAVQLVHATAHLGTARGALFADFVAKNEDVTGPGEYYSYPDLKTVLRTLGFLPPATTPPG